MLRGDICFLKMEWEEEGESLTYSHLYRLIRGGVNSINTTRNSIFKRLHGERPEVSL